MSTFFTLTPASYVYYFRKHRSECGFTWPKDTSQSIEKKQKFYTEKSVLVTKPTAEGFRKMGDCGPSDSEVVKNVTTDGCHVVNGSGVEDKDSVDAQPTDSSTNDVFAVDADNEFPLAIKMMFNYEAESYATAILNAMHR